jgi:hypothetical protein
MQVSLTDAQPTKRSNCLTTGMTHPASHVDDTITVGVLGQCLANDGLAAAKGSRDGAGAWTHHGRVTHTVCHSTAQHSVSQHACGLHKL